ncbi:MAG TPA: HAD family hydrolase [Candidatus Nanoarchaeia archaeon]|nr:HAD family hydrolase [Candidatus Nanoarchaeia archaeon]
MNKAVLFDVDDTLILTSTFIDDVLYQCVISMISAGLPEINPEQAVRTLHEIRKNNKVHGNNFDLLCKVYGIKHRGVIEAGVKRYRKMKLVSLQPNPNAKSTLDYLISKGFKLGVVTTGEPDKQWDKIEVIGLQRYFENGFYASNDPKVMKPNPNLLLQALGKSGEQTRKNLFTWETG